MTSPQDATVTLVIPAFDAAPFLPAALASVAGQSRPFDQVVVVDDASADTTLQVVERWSDLLPLTVVRHPHNRGLGAARRSGIAAASSPLIALLDADDVLLPDHLEVMLAQWRRRGGIVTANTAWWVPGGGLSRRTGAPRKKLPEEPEQRTEILRRNFLHPISLFARADYEQVGGFSELRQMEDWDLWVRMIRAGSVATMPGPVTALYRQRPSSLSAGRGNLPLALEILPGYERSLGLVGEEARILRRALDRRRARALLIEGERASLADSRGSAARLWLRAVWLDRSVRGGLRDADSSVTLQALANLVTMGLVARLRKTSR